MTNDLQRHLTQLLAFNKSTFFGFRYKTVVYEWFPSGLNVDVFIDQRKLPAAGT